MDLVREEIPSSRATLLLVNDKKEIVFHGRRQIESPDNDLINRDVVKKALEVKHPIIHDLKEKGSFWVRENNPKTILCLPLVIKTQPAGVIYLERNLGFGPFSKDNLEFLTAISKAINLTLRNNLGFRVIGSESEVSHSLLVGQSEAFRRIMALIDKVKDSDAPVFIWGESGTGKELVARTIHQTGARKKGKFVAINCGAIPELLLESELFGHVKGAFTGAVKDKPGLIEEADGGTFFLDEIGDLSLHLQAKLLRLLEEKEIRRIGETRQRSVNVRFISATNKNIEEEMKRGNFREDLYYRLKIISIESPPLRERKEDLLFLLNHFLEKYCEDMKREQPFFSAQVLEFLINYPWPGNVRELQNEIQRCLILCGDDNVIKEEHLSFKIDSKRQGASTSCNFLLAKAEFEKQFLNQALARQNYSRAKTAEDIGLSRQGLFKLIKKHGIDVPKKGIKSSTLLSAKERKK